MIFEIIKGQAIRRGFRWETDCMHRSGGLKQKS